MARLTRHDASLRAIELQRTVARLRDLHNGEVEGSKGDQPRRSWNLWRANRLGRLHELERIEHLVAELVDGLPATWSAPELAGRTDTSAASLAAALPKASGNRAKVLDAFMRRELVRRHVHNPPPDGYTDVDLAERTGLPPNSVRPRRGELHAQGWLEDSGERREHNGRPHIVWRLTDAARERLQSGGIET